MRYGSLPLNSTKKFNYNTPYNPRNPYAATKAAADHLAMAYVNIYKLNATISLEALQEAIKKARKKRKV